MIIDAIETTPAISWAIRVAKDAHKFSAAHFLIFADGSAERLHGHNYYVTVTLRAQTAGHGMVIDFKRIKPLIRSVLDQLDERLLIPGRHPALVIERRDGQIDIRHRDRRYSAPADDVLVLPVTNTSSENLAAWIGEALLAAIREELGDVALTALEVEVEETAGQSGIARIEPSCCAV